MTTRADRLVELYILDLWRDENPDHADCTSLKVTDADASNGTYGDTGCDYFTLTAEVGCEHWAPAEFRYGDFGEMWSLIKALETDYGHLVNGDE
jgi:hypothetical protein